MDSSALITPGLANRTVTSNTIFLGDIILDVEAEDLCKHFEISSKKLALYLNRAAEYTKKIN